MKILVGLSGGVDSAYAALKLIAEGHRVEGATLKMHEYTDVLSARKVAEDLGIPLHEIDVTKAFSDIVKKNLVDEYLCGRTPNPCILCNERVKFRALCDYAKAHGFDKIATGHYARVTQTGKRFAVGMAPDNKKEQSYMLYRLPQDVLSMLVLPIGNESKESVRKNSSAGGVSVADKKDSQEICFLPDGHYAEYIESVTGPSSAGDFVDPDGNVLGSHKGIIRYTVGQRKGLGISLGRRAFVTDISPENNTVTLSTEMRGKTEIKISGIVYSGIEPPKSTEKHIFQAKLRYTAPLTETTALLNPDGTAVLVFENPVLSAPGQSAVLYSGECVMLGGYIS